MPSDPRIEGYAEAMLEVARAEGILGLVETELLQVSQAVQHSDELRSTLSDQVIPSATREAIVDDLLGAKGATTVTRSLVSFVVAAGRASQLPDIVHEFLRRAAAEREHEVAEVRSAIPLDAAQQQRLADALSSATGKQVEVKVLVDPDVVGGLIARVGDRVIDGTVRSRLEHLRDAL